MVCFFVQSKISNLGSTWNQLCREISIESYMVTPLTSRLELLPVDGVWLDAFECPLNSLCFLKKWRSPLEGHHFRGSAVDFHGFPFQGQVVPDSFCHTTLLNACQHGEQWKLVSSLQQANIQASIQPNIVSMTTVSRAQKKWQLALCSNLCRLQVQLGKTSAFF